MGCRQDLSVSIPPDKARVSGRYAERIYHMHKDDTIRKVRIISIPHFRDFFQQEAFLNQDGTFSIDVPVVCPTRCFISLEDSNSEIIVYLTPGKESQFEVTVDSTGNRYLAMQKGLGFTKEEEAEIRDVFNNISQNMLQDWFMDREIQPDEYNLLITNNLKKIEKQIDEYPELRYDMKQSLKRRIKWNCLVNYVFNYETYSDERFGRPLKQASDFTFLKHFDLNDSSIFHEEIYCMIFRKILCDKILNIPPIKNMPVNEWLKEVKPVMTGLIGSDSGLFYDLLAANAYYLQLITDIKPLSSIQIENIQAYFGNPAYLNLLLEINQKAIEINQLDKNERPDVSTEKLIDTIVSSQQGKVSVVNFWATWSKPSIQALEQAQAIKSEMKNKNVVFIYITTTTSETASWEEMKRNIGGEHYIMNVQEWDYIFNHYEMLDIPSYLIYDTKGELKNKFTAYPGNEKMQKAIEKLLH
jgi:thiol-disulfide isomerase/thioredoxin